MSMDGEFTMELAKCLSRFYTFIKFLDVLFFYQIVLKCIFSHIFIDENTEMHMQFA